MSRRTKTERMRKRRMSRRTKRERTRKRRTKTDRMSRRMKRKRTMVSTFTWSIVDRSSLVHKTCCTDDF